MKIKIIFALCFLILCSINFKAQVKFDGRSALIDGILLLQDNQDTSAYYYLPKFPVISTKQDKSLEFLCIKYVGDDEQSSGGIFHALFEFEIPDSVLLMVEAKLKEQLPSAFIKSRVPILPNTSNNGEDNSPSFEIISSILTNGGEGGMARALVASGSAPLTPGSKVAVASMLDSKGATLFWNSLQGQTSDLSVGVRGYYEATLPSYNATITIDMEKVYNEFDKSLTKKTSLFSNRDINNKIDTLRSTGGIQIEIADRSEAFDIDETAMQSIVDMISTKVTDMMFEAGEGVDDGSAELADINAGMGGMGSMGGMLDMGMMGMMSMMSMGGGGRSSGDSGGAVDDGVKGKKGKVRKSGKGFGKTAFLAKGALALGAVSVLDSYQKSSKYKLKTKNKINLSNYIINLNKQTSVKVPFYSAGNISGLFDEYKDDDNYFRVISLDDVAFQNRDVAFQVDGDYIEAFNDLLNFVTVKVRKSYPEGNDTWVKEIMFTGSDLEQGINLKNVVYPRLGLSPDEFSKYEYQISWSLKGKEELIHVPADQNVWMKTTEPAISLIPPLVKETIDVDAGRDLFMMQGFASAQINFASMINGKPVPIKRLLLRVNDPEWNSQISVYHDKGQDIVYQTTWYGTEGEIMQQMKVLESNYLFLSPPTSENTLDENSK